MNYNFKLLQITKVFAGQGVHNTADPGEILFKRKDKKGNFLWSTSR